jgi:decaprenylphospho-beta-D-erythro-pentofuranosid-2-ulose 2-reductase
MRSSTTIGSCFVLGSTSEVAQAICMGLVRRGCQRFRLIARDDARNQEVASALRNSFGAAVSMEQTDLIDDASPRVDRQLAVGDLIFI